MSQEITVPQFTKYLNEVFTKGLACPLCGAQEWEMPQEDGVVLTQSMTEPFAHGLVKMLFQEGEFTEKWGAAVEEMKGLIAAECFPIRCGHCGYIAAFDKAFVEGKIHGSSN